MTPSSARTVAAGTTYGTPPQNCLATPILLAWPNKSPNALLDYSVDFTALIGDDTDVLASAFASVTGPIAPPAPPAPSCAPVPNATPLAGWFQVYPPIDCTPLTSNPPPPSPPAPPTGPPLVINSLTVSGAIATVFLAGGAPSGVYQVTVQAYTQAARQCVAVVAITVNTDAALAPAATASGPSLGVIVGPFQPLNPSAPTQAIAANLGTPVQLAQAWPTASGGTVEVSNTDTGDIYIAFGATNAVAASSSTGYLVASGTTSKIAVLGSNTWVAILGTGPGLVRITQGTGG